jgi:hypothetical protein
VAETKGDHAIKGKLAVDGDAVFSAGVSVPYVEIVDQKTKGKDGGAFTQGQWRTRDLTVTKYSGFATSITLGGDGGGGNIVLPAGSYYVELTTPARGVDAHQARLADVTDALGQQASTVVLGSSAHAAVVDNRFYIQTDSVVAGKFELTRATTLEVHHRCETTKEGDGFGKAGNFYYASSVYTNVRLWQLT